MQKKMNIKFCVKIYLNYRCDLIRHEKAGLFRPSLLMKDPDLGLTNFRSGIKDQQPGSATLISFLFFSLKL
jgi:hypothetical protein